MKLTTVNPKNVKEEVQLLGNERPMTKAEHDILKESMDLKKKKKVIIIVWILFIIVVFILSIGVYFMDSIKSAIISFVIINSFVVFAVGTIVYDIKKLLKKDEIFVREAIFLNINKYHRACLDINKNGKRKIISVSASTREKIIKGDKVIILKTRSSRGIYLARE
ncbi:hypothetical protein acsn021_06170 [Anaerocolumna cellulosilytica]|uniref:Uncharacterized protein n=1 Tax=Anaerocolumna cellulosilytica TaxID=433286 RepID=A0A6S6R206_9FIRM|nr:hypothetical protein [Anaerocolumna cellulosilytica]MBB5198168.1 hypothetical protein [Anaerocolumna cellulosilytica]BCJ93048.1 hypothetical protein acsn021_06170 [Anaerocolumna cellulosilytica]